MNIHTEKTQDNPTQSVANATAGNESMSKPTFQFVDNRSQTIAH